MGAVRIGLSKVALVYAMDEKQCRRVAEALAPAAVKLVPQECWSMPVAAVLQGQKPVLSGEIRPLPEPMLVLHGFSGAELDRVLDALRKGGISIPLKAVTTPTNMAWNAYTIFENLSKERKALKKGKSAH